MTERIDEKRREQLHKILDLVLDINGFGARTQKTTGELPTASFDFTGFCGCAEVWLYKKGWSSTNKWDINERVYTDDKHYRILDGEYIIELLEQVKEDMEHGID